MNTRKSNLLVFICVLSILVLFSNCTKKSNPVNPENHELKVEVGTPQKIIDKAREADWSPDGKWLVCAIYKQGGSQEIYIIPTTLDTTIQITNNPARDNYPNWSPDGTTIAFNSNRGTEGNFKIFTILIGSDNPIQRTPNAFYVSGGDWSPDGTRIVFYGQEGSNQGLWTITLGDSQLTQITIEDALWPKYSFDGSRIAFEDWVEEDTLYQIFTIAADGLDRRQITQGGGGYLCWSPDGKWIAFSSDRSGNEDIWIIPSDGGEAIQITTSEDNEVRPAWSPDGKTIAYDTGPYPSTPAVWTVSINITQ